MRPSPGVVDPPPDAAMNALLISTYDLGRQPFGLASPAAWLRRAGVAVTCLDLSREPLREGAVRSCLSSLDGPPDETAPTLGR